MRKRSTAAVVSIALACVIAFSVIGQEEPLPVVVAKAEVPLAEPAIVLAVEPIREHTASPTLVEAARRNDFVTFDALYTAAKARGEDVSRFATLHELWSFSITDPIGAFYGADLYERFRAAYPTYAAYIADYRIVDSRGQVFYPTSETRAFLLDQALEETRRGPGVIVADRQQVPPRPQRAERPAAKPAPAPVQKAPAPAVATVPTPAPAATAPAVAPPVVISAQRAPAATAQPATAPAGARPAVTTAQRTPAATAPAIAPPVAITAQRTPAATAPAVAPPVAITAQPAPAATTQPGPATPRAGTAPAVAPPVVITAQPAPTPTAQPAPATARSASRGILLVVLGLIGVGLLALVLRTPREEAPKIVTLGNVQPLRKTAAAPAAPAPADDTRAAG